MSILSFLNPLGGIASVAKIALIVGMLGSVLVTGYKIYGYIQTSEQNKIIVFQQQQALANDQKVIDQMTADAQLRDQTVQDQQNQINALDQELVGITDNLSDDANNPVPNSIKQVISRLKALETQLPK